MKSRYIGGALTAVALVLSTGAAHADAAAAKNWIEK